jgi:hypothetical protein
VRLLQFRTRLAYRKGLYSEAAMKKKTTTTTSKFDTGLGYVQQMCAELKGAIDQEAVLLLSFSGVFAFDNPALITDAAHRIRVRLEGKELDRKVSAWHKRHGATIRLIAMRSSNSTICMVPC